MAGTWPGRHGWPPRSPVVSCSGKNKMSGGSWAAGPAGHLGQVPGGRGGAFLICLLVSPFPFLYLISYSFVIK